MRDSTCNCNDVTGIIKNDIAVLFDHYTKAEIDEMRAALCRVIDGKADDTTVQTLITELNVKAGTSDLNELAQTVGSKVDAAKVAEMISAALASTITTQDIKNLFAE